MKKGDIVIATSGYSQTIGDTDLIRVLTDDIISPAILSDRGGYYPEPADSGLLMTGYVINPYCRRRNPS
ncbi:MAG: hypothetical protein KZQ99_08505 [Candidatus Thiodiazotropha sp. (ex Dulcina madagascariensis)]|nr:hypothetical protein [Candidatus Thiodiazotropha sp. (ex Dulcina madagascariensis)]